MGEIGDPEIHSSYLKLGPSVDLSDISPAFEVADILWVRMDASEIVWVKSPFASARRTFMAKGEKSRYERFFGWAD